MFSTWFLVRKIYLSILYFWPWTRRVGGPTRRVETRLGARLSWRLGESILGTRRVRAVWWNPNFQGFSPYLNQPFASQLRPLHPQKLSIHSSPCSCEFEAFSAFPWRFWEGRGVDQEEGKEAKHLRVLSVISWRYNSFSLCFYAYYSIKVLFEPCPKLGCGLLVDSSC